MWIFTSKGFLSIVEDKWCKKDLVVRSRFCGHLEKIFGRKIKVKIMEGSDYEYRTTLPREEVQRVIAKLASNIHYTNFKGELGKQCGRGDFDYLYKSYLTYGVLKGEQGEWEI